MAIRQAPDATASRINFVAVNGSLILACSRKSCLVAAWQPGGSAIGRQIGECVAGSFVADDEMLADATRRWRSSGGKRKKSVTVFTSDVGVICFVCIEFCS